MISPNMSCFLQEQMFGQLCHILVTYTSVKTTNRGCYIVLPEMFCFLQKYIFCQVANFTAICKNERPSWLFGFI